MSFGRIRSFWFGLTLPWAALRLILSRRSLLALSAFPLAVTIALYIYAIQGAQSWAQHTIEAALAAWGWADWTVWVAAVFVKIALFIAAALTFSISSSLVASPFNDFLAERTERHSTPPLPPTPGLGIGGQLRLVGIDLMKTIAAGVAGLFALLLSLVPIVNLFAFGLTFLLIAFQYISYPQTRRGQTLRQSLAFLWHHSYACLGFGASIAFIFAIPLISTLALPIAVVGGTLLYARAAVGGADRFPIR